MSANRDERLLFPDSLDPVATDGRDVDSRLAMLQGEAAQQLALHDDERLKQIAPSAWERVPRITDTDTTYYDRPMLKESVWSIDIPIYYFLGGAAGAALTLGAAIQLASGTRRRERELRKASAACHWIGIIGSTAGAGFLIHDLGRPSRFLYMMRVFRPTSPMNMGVWVLAGAAPSAIATGLLLNRRGFLGTIGEVAGYVSGIFGAALAGYTGVLVSSTAIPIWQQSRRWLPALFIASSASTAASIIDIISGNRAAGAIARSFGTAGRVAEIVASLNVEHSASATPKVGEPFTHGAPGFLWRAAGALTAASLVISLLSGKSRNKTRVAGVLGAAGSLCLRFAVHYLGDASARDPRASFHQQRGEGSRAG